MRKATIATAALFAISTYASNPAGLLSPHAQIRTISEQKHIDRAEAIHISNAPNSDMVSAYLTIDPEQIDRDALDNMGVQIALEIGDIATARIPKSVLEALTEVRGIKYVQTATAAYPQVDIARAETGAQSVHQGSDIDRPYTGAGVVIGIVDSGFDYAHAAFRDSDGNLRIKRVWEQETAPSGTLASPAPYGYGTEMTEAQDIINAGGDIRNNSHGSHVTSLAAGSDPYLDGALKGMAPDADIVLVSMLYGGEANVNISNAIAYIFAYADEVGKPCVVNLSLGGYAGPHDGTSTFDVLCDRMQGPGRLIVGAAGNNGNEHTHITASLTADSAPLRTFIDYRNNLSEKNKGGNIEIWGEPGMEMEASLLVVKTSNNEVVERVSIYPAEDAIEVNLGRNVSGTFMVASETSMLNGKAHIVATSAVTAMRTGYTIALEVTPKSSGTVDIWAEGTYIDFTSKGVEGYSDANGSTICEIGGTGKSILTVGAYTTRHEYTLLGDSTPHRLNETDGDRSSFSSYGPTADGRIKPQVMAPGCFIIGAVSQYDGSGTLSYAHYHTDGGTENFYGYMQGTSMATPIVTGIVATWLEAYPDLTPDQLAEIACATARSDQWTGDVSGGSNLWGYGKIDALAGIKACLQHTGGISGVIADNGGGIAVLDRDADSVTLLLKQDISSASVAVYTPSGVMTYAATLTSRRAGDTINLPLGKGIYLIRIGSDTLKIK